MTRKIPAVTRNGPFAPLALIAAALAGAVTGCAGPAVRPLAGEVSLMTVAAHGVQIYECHAAQDAAPAWVFVAPEADLFDIGGRRIGKHGAGPFWQQAGHSLHGQGGHDATVLRPRSPRVAAAPKQG